MRINVLENGKVVTRDMTDEEIAALPSSQKMPPSAEERIAALEAALLSMVLGGAGNG